MKFPSSRSVLPSDHHEKGSGLDYAQGPARQRPLSGVRATLKL